MPKYSEEDGFDMGEYLGSNEDAAYAEEEELRRAGPREDEPNMVTVSDKPVHLDKGFRFNDNAWTCLACGRLAKRGPSRMVYCDCGRRTRL
ncbi:hypothetical protein LCGC14_0397090 [marine sediment metagenome]|uniref:Uncharacterized protein n=1 Tax=marine sediment metagenome TaxID=412755 RepID=A0A0F9VJS6_9ZZZZ